MTKRANRPRKPGPASSAKTSRRLPPPESEPAAGSSSPVAAVAGEQRRVQPFIVPALFLLAYLLVWFVPASKIQDPWNDALSLVNTARESKDPAQRQALLDAAGAQLGELVRRHPYHARLHYLFAYYELNAGNYDAAIAEAKEAIRLGSGAKVNQVDGLAKNLLVEASLKKGQALIDRKDIGAARSVLDDAYRVAQGSKVLLRALGKLAIHDRSWDSARTYFEQLVRIDPRDDEAYFSLANIAVAQKQTPAAIDYLERSLAINPNRAGARELLVSLKRSAASGN